VGERIQKLISAAGLASRRAAEKMILEGRVKVNGQTAVLGQCADLSTDVITVDGVPLPAPASRVYIMLNKPRGYVTTLKDEKGRKTVADLVSDAGTRLYPVGRLDMDSEGLLIMTNDGDTANALMHPAYKVKKTYLVTVTSGDIDSAVRLMSGEMVIDGYRIRPAQVRVVSRDKNGAVLSVTIGEGRNRQVRKMCAKAGLTVKRLLRIRQGELSLGDLPPGKWRCLTKDEIDYLNSLK
jgi:23S rRNA pseudouridine2605 synthase